MEVNPSPFALQALNVDIVLDKIISHLGDNPLDLKKYRLVCHKLNDAVVRKINKSGISFQIPLRYGPLVHQRSTRKALQSVTNILTGTAARIHFDTVVVGSEFFLVEAKVEWEHFLEIHGESIRHFKFKSRTKWAYYQRVVRDCSTIVSMENLRTLFSSTSNLESLDFCVRFAYNGCGGSNQSEGERMFLLGSEVPQLQKLTKIVIQEPHQFSYTLEFLKEILSMAPNLTTLYIKPTTEMITFCRAIKSLENQLQGSLKCLGLSGAYYLGDAFSYLRLTKLELNNLSGTCGKREFVDRLLQIHHSTLVTLILGNRKYIEDINHSPAYTDEDIEDWNLYRDCFSTRPTFPPIMENLKSLDVDTAQFHLPFVYSYNIQFPVLERLTFSLLGDHVIAKPSIESRLSILSALEEADRPSLTLKEFSIVYRPGNEDSPRMMEVLSQHAREIFPTAVHHIGDRL